MSGGLEPKLNACAIGKKAYTNPQKNKQWDSGLKRDGYPLKSSWSANMLFIAFIAFPIPASCGFLPLSLKHYQGLLCVTCNPSPCSARKGGEDATNWHANSGIKVSSRQQKPTRTRSGRLAGLVLEWFFAPVSDHGVDLSGELTGLASPVTCSRVCGGLKTRASLLFHDVAQ